MHTGLHQRSLPVGAEVQPGAGVHFRVWAPGSSKVTLLLSDHEDLADARLCPLVREEDGYWSVAVGDASTGMFYRYQLDDGAFPDIASRFQPNGPHGSSQIIDPMAYRWSDLGWGGVRPEGQIIYEMHIGTFTKAGTWEAAAERLPHLAELGVTLLEILPVADFPGQFGWGYDGVNLFAPTRLYGTPDDFRSFVDRAHALGLGVILDVVYNHAGPDGNYMRSYAPQYFSERYVTEWGEALNFDGEGHGAVRELFVANAGYWIEEFHLDGLRLDATQMILDASPTHIIAEVSARVREAAKGRGTYIVGENEPQDARLIRKLEQGGHGLDALWNDDFHHSAIVALTGRNEAYYTDYNGRPQEFISSAKWGFIYQGQHYQWQQKRRGTPTLNFVPANFVHFLQNHDQIANSLLGHRIHTVSSPARLRALTALLLLGPATPMLFQGQEFASSAPFLYFADHVPELAKLVAKGREEFLRQFPSIASADAHSLIPNPESEETFLRCKLDFEDSERNALVLAMHRDLIRIRKTDLLLGRAVRGSYDGAVLSESAFVLRYFGSDSDDRLLVVNLGARVHCSPAPEPLLAPPSECEWEIHWSSEDPIYGGGGTPPLDGPDNWQIPAEAAVLLVSRKLQS